MRAPSAPYPGTQAVRRAFVVLKAFDAEHPQWSVSDLARHIDLHKTTTFRLLGALEHEGMLARDDTSGTFRLGPQLIALGTQALRSTDLYVTSTRSSNHSRETLAHCDDRGARRRRNADPG